MKFYIKVLLLITCFTGVGYLIHAQAFLDPVIDLLRTYLFLGAATMITLSVLKMVGTIDPKNVGFVFMGLIMVKLGAILIFFPELIDSAVDLPRVEILSFLIPYLLFLIVEIGVVFKWLNDN